MSRILQALKQLDEKALAAPQAGESPPNPNQDSQNETYTPTTIEFAHSVAIGGRRTAVDNGNASETDIENESPVPDLLRPAMKQSSLTQPFLPDKESSSARPAYRTLAQLAASFASDVDLKPSLDENDDAGIPDEPPSAAPSPIADATSEQPDHQHPFAQYATLPSVIRSPSDDSPVQDTSDPYRKIAENICHNHSPGGSISVMLVSLDSGDQIANIVAQVGLMLVERDIGDVLLVDANLKSRNLTDDFTRISRVGLAEILSDQESWKTSVVRTSHERLHLLPAGSMEMRDPDSAASQFAEVMDQLKQRYQFVLVDAGDPQLPLSAALGRLCDLTYLLISLGQTEIDKAEAAAKRIRDEGGRLAGCIVTNCRN